MARIVARPLFASGAGRGLLAASVGALAALAVAVPAAADDLDVYRARFAARQAPNILFVLDFSGSMNGRLPAERGAGKKGPPKIDVLREAMATLLEDNTDRLNAGIGSVFGGVASGVLWPIAPLDADPSTVDPDIPPGYTMAGVMMGQLERRGADGDTRTVDALVEAAQYFRGGTVRNGGFDPKRPAQHRPDRWTEGATPGTGAYGGGSRRAAVAASYAPDQGYWQARYEAGNYDVCADYSVRGGANGCAGKTVIAGSCTSVRGGWYRDEFGVERRAGPHERCRYERADDWDAPSYSPPRPQACQANAIVLISDGQPIGVSKDDTALEAIIGGGRDTCEDLSASVFDVAGLDDVERTSGNCGPELVAALASSPLIAGSPESAVRTYTVGFDVGGPGRAYLERLAEDGDGAYFSADRPEELGTALQRIVDDVSAGGQSFVELAVGVDRATLSSDDRAFMSLFQPSPKRAWNGNLKGYFLDGDGLKGIDGLPAITDTGEFSDDAWSFWSPKIDGVPDGAFVERGGASGKLAAGGRRLYTDAGDGSDLGAPLALSAASVIRSGNGAITAADLGLPAGSPARDAALDWLQTAPMGDPLHSKSVGVDYGDRQVVFVMTNQGLLHAIDATAPTVPGSGDTDGGEELFAYMPRRLLANLPALASRESGEDHVYGLDGGITRWHRDTDRDGVVDPGESLLLILGMRRGGSAYHAIDVSDPESPRLQWVIDPTVSGFGGLAQSWSRPALVNVRSGTGDERVLVFGGGYDADELDGRSKRRDAKGNAVFMVDRAGKLVRRFEAPAMRHSIAADVTPIDSDADGLADRIYAADVGGQIWRIDFDDPRATGGTVTRFADLHTDARPQPLFGAPSVALIRGRGPTFLSISVGSGDRTDPLDATSRNALFMLRDPDVGRGAPSAARIEADDLYDATDDAIGSGTAARAAAARAALEAARGWRVDLAPGEKSLSRIVSFEGALLATTYEPEDDPAADPCTYDETRRFYVVDAATARTANLASGELGEPGTPRSRPIEGSGIPGPAVVVYPANASRIDIVVGPNVVDTAPNRMQRVYWHAR